MAKTNSTVNWIDIVLAALTVIFGFGGGFYFGAFPSDLSQRLHLFSNTLVVGTHADFLLPAKRIEEFYIQTGIKLDQRELKADDLKNLNSQIQVLILPREWLTDETVKTVLTELPDSSLISQLHIDFKNFALPHFLPLFWRIEAISTQEKKQKDTESEVISQLYLVGLSLNGHAPYLRDIQQILPKILDSFLMHEYLATAAPQNWASTLASFESLQVPEKLRPSYLRNFPMVNLKY